ncbi:uncharacterized protein [Nicotiana tomentosiformis]|uniref:uncharacterized protein n=1 Tax=Nicotiana tomentosiformis TaxID=4098 RepID=UPI00388CB9B6
MDTFNGNHFNLNVDLISLVLIPHIESSIKYKVKECITSVVQIYRCTITKRKTFLGHKRAFEIVYDNWDKSFTALPRYKASLQHYNSGTVVEWKHDRGPYIAENIFRYVFWITIGVDANGQIFPLAFAICANESICLIFDRRDGILYSVRALDEWKELYDYHHYCVRHLKVNFQRAYPNKRLRDLIWMDATNHQERKFLMQMELIKQEDKGAYLWLRDLEIEKWTLHKDGGKRWRILITNVSESFNG